MNTVRIGVAFTADVLSQSRYDATLSSLDILLFPELVDGGYAALRQGRKPHSIGDDFVSILKKASTRFSCTIVAGSIFLKDKTPRPTNTSLVFRKGTRVHRYDKIHLFPPAGDRKYFGRGALQPKTFNLPMRRRSIRAGIVICYDIRFPELTRTLAQQGMRVLLVPARWPLVRDEAWQTLLKARAIENQIFVVGCNSQDKEGGYSYGFDPLGRMIFSNRRAPKKLLCSFQLDLSQLTAARSLHRNLQDAVFLRATVKA